MSSTRTTTLVAINVDLTAAILACNALFGKQKVDLDLTVLSEAQRLELTKATFSEGGFFDLTCYPKHDFGHLPASDCFAFPTVAVADSDAATGLLDARAAWRKGLQVKFDAAQDAWSAKSDDDLIQRVGEASHSVVCPLYESGPGQMHAVPSTTLRPEVRDRLTRLQKDCRARDAADWKAAAERQQRIKAQIDVYVADHCTSEQQRLHAEGKLHADEAVSARRAAVFAPLDALFSRHRKFSDKDMYEQARAKGLDGEVRYSTQELLEELHDDEAACLADIRAAADAALADRYEAEARRHWAEIEGEGVLDYRSSVLVTVTDGDRTFSREYAVSSPVARRPNS